MKGMRLSDYQALRFEEPIPKMDVVFHTVGGAAAHSSDRGLHGRSSAKARRGKVVVAVAAQGGAIGKN